MSRSPDLAGPPLPGRRQRSAAARKAFGVDHDCLGPDAARHAALHVLRVHAEGMKREHHRSRRSAVGAGRHAHDEQTLDRSHLDRDRPRWFHRAVTGSRGASVGREHPAAQCQQDRQSSQHPEILRQRNCKSGMGRPAKRRRHGFAINRAHWADRLTRALSVAIPVLAYICR